MIKPRQMCVDQFIGDPDGGSLTIGMETSVRRETRVTAAVMAAMTIPAVGSAAAAIMIGSGHILPGALTGVCTVVLLGSFLDLRSPRRAAVVAAAAVLRRASGQPAPSEGLWECDAFGRFTYANPDCSPMLGYTLAEFRAMTLPEVVHPDERPEMLQLLSTGRGWWRRPFRCVAKDGAEVWLRSSAVARRDEDGVLIGFSGDSHMLAGAPRATGTDEATMAAVRALLRGEGISIAFQPIHSLATGRMQGVEALSRFSVPGRDRSPQDWFSDADEVGLRADLELAAVRAALVSATALPGHLYLSLNLSPETLLWPGLFDLLTGASVDASRIVVEVTEQTRVGDYERLRRALASLRDTGIRIAVDDAGAGYACFRHILQLTPDVIKLDRSLIAGIDADGARRALAAAVATFAHDVGATVVAEGIEESGEMEAALRLGIDAGQGYLLGRPTTAPADWLTWHDDSALSAALREAAVPHPRRSAWTAPRQLIARSF
jgi:PAS domain S-box-containing protein